VRLLRTIKRGRWLEPPAGRPGSAPADALLDLRTRENKLSLWLIDDDESNLVEVVGSIALTREAVSHVDYVTFGFDVVEKIGLDLREAEGDTPVPAANSWHRDAVELSAKDVAELADELFPLSRARVTQREVTSLVETLLAEQRVDVARLNPKISVAVQAGKLLP
jgi:hypothetical protein